MSARLRENTCKAPAKRRVKVSLQSCNDVSEIGHDVCGYDFVVGLDEVGVACLAGPVVAGCFAYPANDSFMGQYLPSEPVRDSKQLSEEQREKTQKILEKDLHGKCHWSVAEASVAEIDRLNIYHASGLAMTRALEAVFCKLELAKPQFRAIVAIDGNKIPNGLRPHSVRHKVIPLVKGDTRVFAIAAASIFAKNYRDPMMKKLAQTFVGYGWETNVGYPTPAHKTAVTALGITEWHRRSFNLNF